MVCDVMDPVTKQRYDRDPRYIAKKAEMYLASTGVADTAYFGAEAEFFIFDNVRFDQNEHEGYYFLDAEEGRWNSGRAENNLGYRPRYREGYFPVPPTDHYQDLRTEMVLAMQSCGMEVECHHHEVATGGQTEIDLRFDSLLRSADSMMLYKYIVKNVANQNGKTVTFMPKPLFQDNGSGMHTHQSLWKEGKPLFAGDGYAGLSQLALWYVGGLIKHGPALSALIAPTTNSYKRLVPGFEAPVNLAYSRRNRSAACAFPCIRPRPKPSGWSSDHPTRAAIHISPSPRCSWQVSTASKTRSIPVSRSTRIFTISARKSWRAFRPCPVRWRTRSTNWIAIQQFLLKADVFTEEMLNTYVDYKREKEVNALRLRPHPYEFMMYYDI